MILEVQRSPPVTLVATSSVDIPKSGGIFLLSSVLCQVIGYANTNV